MLKYFTIYGERCSGTNFLENAIKENFELNITWKYDFKHFFGQKDFKNTEDEDKTMFIGIIRNPVDWIDSFYNRKHHIPSKNRINIDTFLFNEFYSILDNGNEIIEDRNMITKKRYKNIFECRFIKNNFLIETMPKKVKNYLLIRYEDLYKNYDTVLGYLEHKFGLVRKNKNFIKINSYKGDKEHKFIVKNISLNKAVINKIINNVNIKQEQCLGYLM